MNSHPMLQPTDWTQPPSSLVNGMPEVRLQLYRLIWDCALACTLRAPALQHVRTIFKTDSGHEIAFAAAIPHADRLGYLRFRVLMPISLLWNALLAPGIRASIKTICNGAHRNLNWHLNSRIKSDVELLLEIVDPLKKVDD